MKRIFLSLLLVLVFILPSFSQRSLFSKFEIGIEGGPNFTAVYNTTPQQKIFTIGFSFTGGVSFQANLSSLLSLRTNLSFERKVQRIKGEVVYTDDTGKEIGLAKVHTNYDYLVLPVLARFNFGERVKFFVNVGPYFGLLLQATNILNIPGYQKITSTDKGGQIDIGVCAGLGVAIPIHDKFSLTIEARDNLGLLPIFKGGNVKTNAAALLIGFAYLLPNR